MVVGSSLLLMAWVGVMAGLDVNEHKQILVYLVSHVYVADTASIWINNKERHPTIPLAP